MCGIVTVGQVLADPEAHRSESFIDPLETHTGTNYRAKLMQCEKSATDKTKVWKIRSYIHGGTFYSLEAARVELVDLVPLDQPIPDFIAHAPHTRLVNKEYILMPTLENLKALAAPYGVSFEYDIIRREKSILFAGERKSSDLSNDANLHKLRNLCVINRLNPNVTEGINEIFYENEKNNVTDFIKNTQWDGIPRIEGLFQTLTLAHQTDYEYGLNILKTWLIQCVAAADHAQSTPLKYARPKFENVFILVSPQGNHKTAWFGALLPVDLAAYFKDGAKLVLDDKDSVFEATCYWITEWGEVDATFKKSCISSMKAFLSSSFEVIRRPYDKVANSYKRRTSFCGSVNDAHFLHDVTGNRRYLPLEITNCDNNHAVDMTQVWAEVWGLYIGGEKWWFDKNDSIASDILAHQRGAMNHDPIIEEFILWNGGEPTPDDTHKLPFKKYTVKGLIQTIRGEKVSFGGSHIECVVTARDMDKLRAYLNERGFIPQRIGGVMKYSLCRDYEVKEFLRNEQNRLDLQEKLAGEVYPCDSLGLGGAGGVGIPPPPSWRRRRRWARWGRWGRWGISILSLKCIFKSK